MQIRSKVVRSGVWIVLGLVAGCEPDPPVGSLVVTVLRDSPPVAANGAQVNLGAVGQVTGASGIASFLLPPGTYAIKTTLITYCPAITSATVTTSATTNVTMSLGATPCVTSGSDRIATGGSEPLYGLVDIRTGVASSPPPCENDRLVEGALGDADLLTNALPLTGISVSCHGAAWVFTEYHAPWFDNTAATFLWSNASGDVVTTPLPANRLRVPVTFWLSDAAIDEAATQAALTGTDLPKANDFLRKIRSGLLLTNSEAADNLPDIIDVGSQPTIGIGCRNTSSIIASPLVYRPAHINIYVVEAIDGDGVALGHNCIAHGAANVIFMKDDAGYVTLVHEIGHALALTRPHWGHTDYIAGMFPENVMTSGATIAGHMSLGQIARMHADGKSWLNQVTGIGTVRTRQMGSASLVTACSCPGAAATDDCPKVDADIARTGALPGKPDPSCHVTTDVTCLSLSPGGSASITANGWTDGTATILGTGEGTVSSLAPTLVSATKPPVGGEGPGWVKADVTAGTISGATDVLMSIGGTFAKVKIKIGSTCP